MEPIFRKCLIALEKISEHSLPTMEIAYQNYMNIVKTKTLTSECLNQSKAIVVAANVSLDSGLIDNKKVLSYLQRLIHKDSNIIKRSKDLNEKLERNQSRFIRYSKDIASQHRDFIYNLKNGEIPAEELLRSIIELAKEIQRITNNEVPLFQKEIEAFLKKVENEICNEVNELHNKIQKLDPGVFPMIKTREWTYLESRFLERKGAFVKTDYEAN